MLWPLLAVALQANLFETDFSTSPADLRLVARPPGVAAVRGGVLVLDLTAAEAGKLAGADLARDLPVPCRITWDQRLAADSPHAYWSGLQVRGSYGTSVAAHLGGEPCRHQVGLEGLAPLPTAVPPGTWVHFELHLERGGQRLRASRRDTGQLIGETVRRVPSPQPPVRLRFFANATPDELPDGDAYAQSRGRHEFDNLAVAAVEASLARGGEPYDLREPVVFNRAMRWRATPAGPLVWSEGDLPLTGATPVSNWAHGGAVRVRHDGEATTFARSHLAARGADQIVLRQLQFHLGQHPRLRYALTPSNARVRLRATFTCPNIRHSMVVAETPWFTAAQSGELDLVAGLARWREQRVYAELDFILELAAPEGIKDGDGSVRATLSLPRQSAVVAPTHVVRPAGGAVPIAALVVAGGAVPERVWATHTQPATPLIRRDGLWSGALNLPAGIHAGEVVARVGEQELRQPVEVRVSGQPFVVARPGEATYSLADGTRLPPLLGDLFAWTLWDNPTSLERRIVRGPETWAQPGRPQVAKWRWMTARELDERIAWQADECGARALRLVPNTTPFESLLDAGGHVAPHGLEQLQRLLTVFERHRVHALINLFHYQYGSGATGFFPPLNAYLDAGYRGPADFTKPAAVALERAYLDELLAAIGQDPAVLGYSLFGENDDLPGAAWANSMATYTKQRCRQLVVFEQGGGLQNHRDLKPDRWDGFVAARDGGVGYRTYYSQGTPTDAYLNVNARWYAQHQPAFLAEACSDGPGWYRDRITWLAPDFRTQFRDSLWASLCAPQTLSLYWSVCFIERERRLPTLIAERLDWRGFQRAKGLLAVVVPAANVARLPRLTQLDEACSAAGVTYDIVAPGTDLAGYAGVIDLSAPTASVDLPAAVRDRSLLRLSPGNGATILTDAAGTMLLAYVRNVGEHRLGPGYGDDVKELHRQRTAAREVTLELRAPVAAGQVTVWDVDTGEVVQQGPLSALKTLALGRSTHDFAVLVQRR